VDAGKMEKALVGWKAIAEFLSLPISTATSKRHEMKRAGIIFNRLQGKPPNRRWVVYTFPSLLILWSSLNDRQKKGGG